MSKHLRDRLWATLGFRLATVCGTDSDAEMACGPNVWQQFRVVTLSDCNGK